MNYNFWIGLKVFIFTFDLNFKIEEIIFLFDRFFRDGFFYEKNFLNFVR